MFIFLLGGFIGTDLDMCITTFDCVLLLPLLFGGGKQPDPSPILSGIYICTLITQEILSQLMRIFGGISVAGVGWLGIGSH